MNAPEPSVHAAATYSSIAHQRVVASNANPLVWRVEFRRVA